MARKSKLIMINNNDVIPAIRWFSNGDHPKGIVHPYFSYCVTKLISHNIQVHDLHELCSECHNTYEKHGILVTNDNTVKLVCPGDFVTTMKEDIKVIKPSDCLPCIIKLEMESCDGTMVHTIIIKENNANIAMLWRQPHIWDFLIEAHYTGLCQFGTVSDVKLIAEQYLDALDIITKNKMEISCMAPQPICFDLINIGTNKEVITVAETIAEIRKIKENNKWKIVRTTPLSYCG